MKKLIALGLLLGSTQSLAVTIDFEELATFPLDIYENDPVTINTKSFEFTQPNPDAMLAITNSDANNSLLACFLADTGGCSAQGNSGQRLFTLAHSDGDLFSLHSLDFEYFNSLTGNGTFYFDPATEYNDCLQLNGFRSDGSRVSTYLSDLSSNPEDYGCNYTGALSTVLFDSDWSNLTRIEFHASTMRDSNTDGLASFDNIVVSSVVPIPAAVWLFGSALAGVGLFRRSKSLNV